MNKNNIETITTQSKNKIFELLDPIIEEIASKFNLTVLETSFNKERGKYVLRIFIYNPIKPVAIEDCSTLSNLISNEIDNLNIIEIPYSLEVSSPGVNRKLKNPIEYKVFKGKQVKATLKQPLNNEDKNNVIIGTLIGLSEDSQSAIIGINNKEILIELIKVKVIQLEG